MSPSAIQLSLVEFAFKLLLAAFVCLRFCVVLSPIRWLTAVNQMSVCRCERFVPFVLARLRASLLAFVRILSQAQSDSLGLADVFHSSNASSHLTDVVERLPSGSTPRACRLLLERNSSHSRCHATQIVMRAVSALRSSDSFRSIVRSRLIDGIGAALVGGSTVASCCAVLRGQGFSRSHAKRIVRKVARLRGLDTAASQRSQVVADIIDRLMGGRTLGECRYVLRERGFTSKQTRAILHKANQGAAQQRAAIQDAAQSGPSIGVETDEADSSHQLTFV